MSKFRTNHPYAFNAVLIACLLVIGGAIAQVSVRTTLASDIYGLAGRLFLHTDSALVSRDEGTSLSYWTGLYPVSKPPAISTWTQLNMGTSNLAEASGAIFILAQPTTGSEGSNSLRFLCRTPPATPYSIVVAARWMANQISTAGGKVMVGWRQSSSSKLVTLHAGVDSSVGYYGFTKWTNESTYSANYVAVNHWGAASRQQFFKIQDTGVNLVGSVSADGFNWQQISSQSRTDYLTVSGPDQVVFGCSSSDTTWGTQCVLDSWLVQ